MLSVAIDADNIVHVYGHAQRATTVTTFVGDHGAWEQGSVTPTGRFEAAYALRAPDGQIVVHAQDPSGGLSTEFGYVNPRGALTGGVTGAIRIQYAPDGTPYWLSSVELPRVRYSYPRANHLWTRRHDGTVRPDYVGDRADGVGLHFGADGRPAVVGYDELGRLSLYRKRSDAFERQEVTTLAGRPALHLAPTHDGRTAALVVSNGTSATAPADLNLLWLDNDGLVGDGLTVTAPHSVAAVGKLQTDRHGNLYIGVLGRAVAGRSPYSVVRVSAEGQAESALLAEFSPAVGGDLLTRLTVSPDGEIYLAARNGYQPVWVRSFRFPAEPREPGGADDSERVYTARDLPAAIEDFSLGRTECRADAAAQTRSHIDVGDRFKVGRATVRFALNHGYVEDLRVALAYNGREVALLRGCTGGPGEGGLVETLDVPGATGLGAHGRWSLHVSDHWSNQEGTLTAFELSLTPRT